MTDQDDKRQDKKEAGHLDEYAEWKESAGEKPQDPRDSFRKVSNIALLVPKSRKSQCRSNVMLNGICEKASNSLPSSALLHFEPLLRADLRCSDLHASLPIAQHISR